MSAQSPKSICPWIPQNQQHDIEVKIETQKSHRKHFEARLKELQDTIKKAEREHENMKKLVRVSECLRETVALNVCRLAHFDAITSIVGSHQTS